MRESTSPTGGPEPATPLLPATYRFQHMVRLVRADVRSFLECELDVSRLNRIHGWLWLCGLPSTPRPLHYQKLKKREIVIAEQADLHLVWSPSRIFIKPLPRYLLSPKFWKTDICPHDDLYRTALGFLLSYATLIEREADFKIAKESGLIPEEVSWTAWLEWVEEIVTMSAYAESLLSSPSTSSSSFLPHVPVNERFYYGELRIGRLNWIYRLVLGKPRGYLSGCTTYGAFMRQNINSLLTLFAYTTIVLSAMQVGLTTPSLTNNYTFGMAAYIFSIFAILAPLLTIFTLSSILVVLFVANLLRTLRIRGKRRRMGAGV
ncbi:hypothetical protein BDV95DRAFT_503009 [Massariosphaeria phaeospora]|uniref:Uncharacterized protein n=1 Tax=Massariosphaeria phaeospora TaxID=100035 RepID=A0A7C8M4H0_9PLEO|nr:hypothetical protein BDV95DRAFT_503009 [Massariosphaeria phaeospora]